MSSSKLKIRYLFLTLAILVLIISSCQQSNKNVIISEKEINLEPNDEKTFYIGINNINDEDKKFKISYECNNCNDEIKLQMFPEIGLQANREGAFPIKIITSNKIKEGNYEIQIKIMEENKQSVTKTIIIRVKSELNEIIKERINDL